MAKLFMDRCFALPTYSKKTLENAFAGKRVGIAMSYGDTDPFNSGCVNALRTFQGAFNYDMAAKRRKMHKNQISELVISMGYEIEIREF
jgi:hypothetical protein